MFLLPDPLTKWFPSGTLLRQPFTSRVLKRHLAYLHSFLSFEPEYIIIINMLKLNNFPWQTSNKIIFLPLFCKSCKFLVYQLDPRHLQGSRVLNVFVYVMKFVLYIIVNHIFVLSIIRIRFNLIISDVHKELSSLRMKNSN